MTPVEHNMKRGKLDPKYQGPFKLLEIIKDVVARVQSTLNPAMIKEVHVDRLRPFILRPDQKNLVSKLVAADSQESVVQSIVDHIGSTKKNMLFRVNWEGWGSESDTWEPLEHVNDTKALDVYLDANPLLKKIIDV